MYLIQGYNNSPYVGFEPTTWELQAKNLDYTTVNSCEWMSRIPEMYSVPGRIHTNLFIHGKCLYAVLVHLGHCLPSLPVISVVSGSFQFCLMLPQGKRVNKGCKDQRDRQVGTCHFSKCDVFFDENAETFSLKQFHQVINCK